MAWTLILQVFERLHRHQQARCRADSRLTTKAAEQVPQHILHGNEPTSNLFRLLIRDSPHHAGRFGQTSVPAVGRRDTEAAPTEVAATLDVVITESQARAMIEECEVRIGRTLDGLRKQLLWSDNTLGALWELIVLHACVQLGPGVDHEPAQRMPDIVLSLPGVEPFAVEATHIDWPDREEQELRHKFIDWVRVWLQKRNVDPSTFDPHLGPSDPNLNHDIVPPEHLWKALLSTDEWSRIVDAAERPPNKVEVHLPPPFRAKLAIEFTGVAKDGLSAGFRAAGSIERVADHPVYAALRSKSKQASNWKREEPIVVCIGSSLTTSLFPMAEAHPGAEAAVAAALMNTSRWPIIDQLNRLRDGSGKDYSVRGAKRISAVVLTSIEAAPHLGWPPPTYNRVAVARLLLNPEAAFPLTKAQLDALAKLNLNLVPYGPQWETWRTPTASAWKDPSRIMNRNEPGKDISYGHGGRGGFTLQFAAEDLVRLLAGLDPAQSLRESIEGIHAGGRLRGRPIITSIEMVPGDAKQRKPDMVKVTFTPRPEPLVQGLKTSAETQSQVPSPEGDRPPSSA